MQKFRVGFYYEESGTCVVEARSKEEAEFIMHDRLAQEGIDGLTFDGNNRDYGSTGAEDVTNIGGISSDISDGEHVPDDEFEGEGKWDMSIYLMDVDEDPTTPYYETEITVLASNEEEARSRAKDLAYELKEASGVNLSVEVEVA